MFDLHRHDEYSTFDGFGKAKELAELCKEYGYRSLSTTNHGNTNGLIATYKACKDAGLKAILGVEGYFLPKYKESTRGYHLILIAKNLEGYKNLNRLQYEGEKQKYYNPIWDFKLLEQYHEGLICSTACVAGYLAKCILSGKMEIAEKYLLKLQSIFHDDLYVEIQPYKVSEEGMQEQVNREAWKLAKKLGIKCILTSDSHRGRKEELDTYIKMHEIAGHDIEHIEETYSERYMPLPDEMQKRFYKMHKNDFNTDVECKGFIRSMVEALDEIEDKCEADYLDVLPLQLPELGSDTHKKLVNDVKEGLKKRNKYTKSYIERCKTEIDVIKYHHFEDYFLIVADYVRFAKDKGIAVGAGRGSVCNCLVAYALGITEVDSLLFDLDFRRFLRKDKNKFPDIDLDFQTSRRHEVIEYLCKKYEGHSARICSYGLYKVDNLLNDLAKVCGLATDKTIDPEQVKMNKTEIAKIKNLIKIYIDEDGSLNVKALLKDSDTDYYNQIYDKIILHFTKLYKKVRYIGTHSAGVAITNGNLLDYTALRIDKEGDVYTAYDLEDMENINVIKFDILGLKTMESINDLRKATGDTCNYDEIVKDPKILERFASGATDGIFQFESKTPRKIMQEIECDSFADVVAVNSMNRPASLSLGQPELYAENKKNIEKAKQSLYYEYTKDSYGTIIYQEQIQQICVNIGGLSWGDADKVMKLLKDKGMSAEEIELAEQLKVKFVSGCSKNGIKKEDAEEIFKNILTYSFNKGHATGYSLISFEEMYYKVYHPNEYWFSKIKYAKNDEEYARFCENAVIDGSVVFLPHVNYSTEKTRIRKVEGSDCLQQGLSDIKGIGLKASEYIVAERKKNGIFTSFDDFYDRCKSRSVTSRVIDILLHETSALVFDKKTYIQMVTKYNSALYMRGSQK